MSGSNSTNFDLTVYEQEKSRLSPFQQEDILDIEMKIDELLNEGKSDNEIDNELVNLDLSIVVHGVANIYKEIMLNSLQTQQ